MSLHVGAKVPKMFERPCMMYLRLNFPDGDWSKHFKGPDPNSPGHTFLDCYPDGYGRNSYGVIPALSPSENKEEKEMITPFDIPREMSSDLTIHVLGYLHIVQVLRMRRISKCFQKYCETAVRLIEHIRLGTYKFSWRVEPFWNDDIRMFYPFEERQSEYVALFLNRFCKNLKHIELLDFQNLGNEFDNLLQRNPNVTVSFVVDTKLVQNVLRYPNVKIDILESEATLPEKRYYPPLAAIIAQSGLQLKHINIPENDDLYNMIPGNVPNLEHFGLSRDAWGTLTQLPEGYLTNLAKLSPKIKALSFETNVLHLKEEFQHFCNLQTLDLNYVDVDGNYLNLNKYCPNLTALRLKLVTLPVEEAIGLSNFPKLKKLDLTSPTIDNFDLESPGSMKHVHIILEAYCNQLEWLRLDLPKQELLKTFVRCMKNESFLFKNLEYYYLEGHEEDDEYDVEDDFCSDDIGREEVMRTGDVRLSEDEFRKCIIAGKIKGYAVVGDLFEYH